MSWDQIVDLFYNVEDNVGRSYDFRRTEDCLDGAGPVIAHMKFDSHIISMLFIIIVATPMNAVIVYKYLFEMPPHPKFLLLRWYKFFTHLHIASGSVEIIAGLTMFFIPWPVPVVKVQACASVVHAVTALALIPLLFGMKLFMNTIYGTGVVMKIILAINVLLNPDCYRRTIALVAFHTVYAWVRVFFVFLRFINVMRYCRYTVAVLLASVVVMPVVDRLANAINLCLICLAGVYIGCSSDEHLRVEYTTEFSRDITTFQHYCKQFERAQGNTRSAVMTQRNTASLQKNSQDSQIDLDLLLFQDDAMDKDPQVRSRCIFSLMAERKQHLHYSQLAAMLCSFGMPKNDVTTVMEKFSHGHGSIDYDTFHGEMKPLWEYVFFEMKRSMADTEHEDNIKTESTAEFSRLSQAYRQHLGSGSDTESDNQEMYENGSDAEFAPDDASTSAREVRVPSREDPPRSKLQKFTQAEIKQRCKY